MVLFGFAVTLGLHVSLRISQSRLAIAHTLGTVFFLSVGTLISIYLIVINGGSFGNQWVSFISFLILGIGGLLYVLSADRPSPALSLASVACPLAMFYCVVNILIAQPRYGRIGRPADAVPGDGCRVRVHHLRDAAPARHRVRRVPGPHRTAERIGQASGLSTKTTGRKPVPQKASNP